MTADPSQFELDDELLSAYLDDELSIEERAAVEQRLASDPAAQQMLEELRHVSQAVHNLPPESIGRDIRMSVLERIQAAKELPLVPPVTIGRSRRGWVWASLAVAAALLIAVFVPDQPNDAELPAIAQHSQDGADRPVLRAAPKASNTETAVADGDREPPASDSFGFGAMADKTTSDSQPQSGNVAQNSAAAEAPLALETPAAPMPAASAPDPANEAADALAVDATAPSPTAPASPPLAAATTAGALAESQSEPMVVVRVLAKRDALTRGTFEKLLASNGVQVDPQPSAEPSVANGAVDLNASDRDAEEQSAAAEKVKAAEQEGVEFLVEAPRDTIFNCVAGLNQDSLNYLGVEVDHVPTEEKSAKSGLHGGSQQADGLDSLTKYNRGIVPRRGGEARMRNEGLYYRDLGERTFHEAENRYADVANEPTDDRVELQQKLRQEAVKSERSANNGRARRLSRFDQAGGGAGGRAVDSKSFAEGLGRNKSVPAVRGPSKLEGIVSADTSNMQVLFVLDPTDEPAASPPAENPPQ